MNGLRPAAVGCRSASNPPGAVCPSVAWTCSMRDDTRASDHAVWLQLWPQGFPTIPKHDNSVTSSHHKMRVFNISESSQGPRTNNIVRAFPTHKQLHRVRRQEHARHKWFAQRRDLYALAVFWIHARAREHILFRVDMLKASNPQLSFEIIFLVHLHAFASGPPAPISDKGS